MGVRSRRARGAAVWLPVLLWAARGIAPCQAQAPAPPLPAPVPAPAVPALPAPGPAPPATPPHFLPRVSSHLETTAGGATYAVLTIDETDAATIRASAGGFTPAQRAALAVQRLVNLLQGGLLPGEIAAQPDAKPQWEVAARGGPLLLATPEEAAAHRQSPKSLAESWTRSLQRLLSEPPLTLPVDHLIVPFGESRSVRVGGAVLAADVRVQGDDAAIVMPLYDPATRTLTLQGRATGSETVTVAPAPGIGGAALTLPVTVMRYAGEVAPAATVQITGAPAPAGIVAQAAYLGLTQTLRLEQGAQIALAAPPALTAALPVGARSTEAFPVRLSGSGLLPVTASPSVTVINTPLAAQPPALLFYSNNPEQIKHAQSLFIGRLPPSASVRLDFHHQNQSGHLLTFHVDLLNSGDMAASVQVIAGLSLPGGDTVQVGRRAGAQFLENLNADAGLVLTVPPHSALPLVTQRFAPGLTLSGLAQIQNLSAAALTLSVHADDDTDALASPLWRVYMAGDGGSALAAPSEEASPAGDAAASPDIFLRPQVTLTGRYVVDGRWAFVTLGEGHGLHAQSGKLRLSGNYGVDCDIALTLVNPTPDARAVGLYFAPGAGPAAGVFQVDGGPIQEYDPLSPPDERQLALVTLAPGETRVVHLHTIPLNGSAYPAEVVARALDKAPAPPAPPPTPPPAPAITSFGKAGH